MWYSTSMIPQTVYMYRFRREISCVTGGDKSKSLEVPYEVLLALT